MNNKKAKKEIYDFLVNKLKISTDNILDDGDIWKIITGNTFISISFDLFSCDYYLNTYYNKLFTHKYKEIKEIKSNFKKIVKAIRLLDEVS